MTISRYIASYSNIVYIVQKQYCSWVIQASNVAVATTKARARAGKVKKVRKKSGVSGYMSAEEESCSDENDVGLDEVRSWRLDVRRRNENYSVSPMEREWAESDEESGEEEVNSVVPQLYVPGLLETVMQKIQHRPSESGDGSGLGEVTSKVNNVANSIW